MPVNKYSIVRQKLMGAGYPKLTKFDLARLGVENEDGLTDKELAKAKVVKILTNEGYVFSNGLPHILHGTSVSWLSKRQMSYVIKHRFRDVMHDGMEYSDWETHPLTIKV